MSVVSPEQVSIGVLVDAVPRDAVDDAVAVCGVRERRSDGKLPAHVITYLTLGLCLFPDDDYEEVAARVTGSLDRFGCWDASWSVPAASAIRQARKRLGRGVFPELFERTCGPVAGETGPTAGLLSLCTAGGSFSRGWRLLAIDGFELDVRTRPRTPRSSATPDPDRTGRRSRRLGWSRWPSAARMPSWPPNSTPIRSGRRPWRSGCIRGCAPTNCSPPTAASTPGPGGTPPPRPAPRCCGARRPHSPCLWCGCSPTAPTSPS